MRKLTFTFLIAGLMLLSSAQGQTLVNVLHLNSISIEKDGKTVGDDDVSGNMIIAYNKSKVKVFQNNELTCWVEMSYKTCGKKVKLTRKTVVELANGDSQSSKAETVQYKIGEDDPGYFIGKSAEDFLIGENEENKLVVRYGYEFRYKDHGLAYQ